MNNELNKVWRLLKTSEDFISKAKTTKGFDYESINQYNTYIKCSLNCLLKIIKLYGSSLNAQIEATLYLKIATILFEETASFDMAREYCNKGIQICKRNEPHMIFNKIQLQYVSFQIQFECCTSVGKRQAMAYINQVIDEIPDLDTYLVLKIFFKFTKLRYFEANSSYHQVLFVLTNLIKSFKSCLNSGNYAFYEYLLINKIQHQITNNLPISETMESIQQLENVQLKYKSNSMPQFIAIAYFAKAMLVLEVNDYSQTKEHMKALNSFLKSTNNDTWKNKEIVVKLSEGFSVQFQWLSYDEFLIVSYILLGVTNMIKPWDEKATNSIFERASKLIDQRLDTIAEDAESSLSDLFAKKVKLKYIKYIVDIYSIFSLLIADEYPKNIKHDVFEDYSTIRELLNNFENNELLPLEIKAYQSLFPLLMYMKAVIYHRSGDLDNAFETYLGLILNFSNKELPENKDDINTTQKSQSLGISNIFTQVSGVRNQLYCISLINILPLLEVKIERLKMQQEMLDEFDSSYETVMGEFESYLKLKSKLKQDLNSLKTVVEHETNGMKQDWLVYLTVLALDYSIGDDPEKEGQSLMLFQSILCNSSDLKSSCNTDNIVGSNYNYKNLNLILDVTPMLKSILNVIVGLGQRSNTIYSAKNNINFKIAHFSRVMKYSKKAQPKRSNELRNSLGKLAALKIKEILEINSNLFESNVIENIENDIKSFN